MRGRTKTSAKWGTWATRRRRRSVQWLMLPLSFAQVKGTISEKACWVGVFNPSRGQTFDRTRSQVKGWPAGVRLLFVCQTGELVGKPREFGDFGKRGSLLGSAGNKAAFRESCFGLFDLIGRGQLFSCRSPLGIPVCLWLYSICLSLRKYFYLYLSVSTSASVCLPTYTPTHVYLSRLPEST